MPELPRLLAALDNRRAEFLAGLESVPPEQRDRAPSQSAWSPLQIGEHLLISERGFARITARQLEKGDDRRRFGEPSERSVEGLLQAMRTPARFKIPEGVEAITPTGDVPYEVLRRDWLATGERWHEIVAAFPPELETEALVMHPVGGPLTTAQTLRFLEAHIEHHLHQLGRTVRALNQAPA
jgi:hypothetical protein